MKEMKKVAVMFVLFVSVAIAGFGVVSEKQISAQQIGVGCGYMAGETEGGVSGAWDKAGDLFIGSAVVMAGGGTYAAVATTTNPVGWAYWAATGLVAL